MMWNEKRHYSPPLPVESASDHVTCERMLGVLSAETLGDPYHSKTPLPRIPVYREHTQIRAPVTAAAATAISVQPSLAKQILCRVASLASAANSYTKIIHTRIGAACS